MPHPRLGSPPRRSRLQPRPAESPRILLLCPEALGPQVCCVEDALRARGYRVEVAVGRAARRWVRTVPPGSATVRVLCVPPIDPAYAQRLCQGRPDFHIVGWETPRVVVEQIERVVGRVRSGRRPRPSRMILAQPTLLEQSLHVQRRWGRGVLTAAAAATLVACGGLLGAWASGDGADHEVRPSEAQMVRATPDETVAPRATTRRARVDEPVLSAVVVDSEVFERRRPSRSR